MCHQPPHLKYNVSLLDNAPNLLVWCIIQKRNKRFGSSFVQCVKKIVFFSGLLDKKKIPNVYSKKMFQINKLLSQKILFVISNTIQILGTHLVPLLVNCCSQSGPKNKTKILTVYLGTEGPRANLCGPTEHLKNLKIKKENIVSFG